MKNWTRRDLLKTSLLAPAVAAAHGKAPIGVPSQVNGTGPGPLPATAAAESSELGAGRERLLLDFGWCFHLGHAHDPAKDFGFGGSRAGNFQKTGNFLPAGAMAFDDSDWQAVDLPHDWAVELPFENDPALWLADLPRPNSSGNKYSRGHGLISGGYPITGAARMAARATARAGSGLTTIAVPEIALPIYAAALTSILVRPVVEPGDFGRLLADRRISAFLIGPGVGGETRALAMPSSGRATLIDADAITTFQDDPEALDRAIVDACVVTPHKGEFKRVFNASGDKLQRTRAAARRSGAIVVLKGANTVIAAPDDRAIINANAPPTLATPGSGDVLSGFIVGLLAQGMEPFLAAAAAVWLHGAAAVAFGPGLVAEDLPDILPRVLRGLQDER